MQPGRVDTCFALHIVAQADAMAEATHCSSSESPLYKTRIIWLTQIIDMQVREVPAGHPARTLGGKQGRTKESGVYARKV